MSLSLPASDAAVACGVEFVVGAAGARKAGKQAGRTLASFGRHHYCSAVPVSVHAEVQSEKKNGRRLVEREGNKGRANLGRLVVVGCSTAAVDLLAVSDTSFITVWPRLTSAIAAIDLLLLLLLSPSH